MRQFFFVCFFLAVCSSCFGKTKESENYSSVFQFGRVLEKKQTNKRRIASKGLSLECDPRTDVLGSYWGFWRVVFFWHLRCQFSSEAKSAFVSIHRLVHSSLLSLSACMSFFFFLLLAEADSMSLHRDPWGWSRGLWVTEPGREGGGHSERRKAGIEFVPFFLAASPQKPDLGLRRFCVVRVWLQDECFSMKLWQCIKKVWIMFLSLLVYFIWVRIRTERWVRCRFFLAR